jgi:lipoate-protein ligase A
LHYRELTYSVTASLTRYPVLGRRLEETLELIAGALILGLARIGVSASAVRRREPVGRQEGACFESSTRFELVDGGAKLVGSAQYRTPAAFLQHGSIPAFAAIRDLYALGGAEDKAPPESKQPAPWATMAPDRTARALVEGFAESFGSKVVFRDLGTIDNSAVANLARKRYAHAEWTFRR